MNHTHGIRLGLVGCGLIGGSFALALRRAGAVRTVRGFSRSAATLQTAIRLGVIDAAATSAADAAADCDVVMVAVPVAATEATLRAIAPQLQPHTLVIDAGSTKGDVVDAARVAMGKRLSQFVPCHPIAGKEVAGVEHADATLYEGRHCIITPTEANDAASIDRATSLWQSVGAIVRRMRAAEHDATFAAVSHLPHLLAYAYVLGVAQQPAGMTVLSLAGPGFRDFSRIAASEPAVWRDILMANRTQVLQQAQAFREQLDALEQAMQRADAAAIEQTIGRASDLRRRWRMGSGIDED